MVKFTINEKIKFESDLNETQVFSILEILKDNKNAEPRARNFASSLVKQYQSGRTLSYLQIAWAHKLAIEANQPVTEPTPAPKINVNLSQLVSILHTAKGHLKYPKIRLQLGKFTTLVLSLGKDDTVFIQDANRKVNTKYGVRKKYYGKVLIDGTFEPCKDVPEGLVELLQDMSNDPARTAANYGHLTGHCCFCALPLSDERSTLVGYGPVCAAHFGLPWG